MISAIHAANVAYYTSLAYSSSYSMIRNNMTRMSLLRNCSNMSFQGLAEAERNLELQYMQQSLQNKIANIMLKNLKEKEKQEQHINTYA